MDSAMPWRPRCKPETAFSLVEVLISVVVFSIMSFAMLSALIFSSRATRFNSNAIAAKNVAQGFFEIMAVDQFANVSPPPDKSHNPPNGGYADVNFDSDPPVWLDEALDIRCQVAFAFKGFGVAEGGSASVLTDDDADWETNEWAGDTLYLVGGRGTGQYAMISANSSNQLLLAGGLAFAPDTSTKYMINGGKTIEITTTWEFMAKSYSQTIESLIVNYRNEQELGF